MFVRENFFYRGLAVVEIALYGNHVDVCALLRAHLQLLHFGNALGRVKDHNLYTLRVLKAFERGFTGIARGCGKDKNFFLYPAYIRSLPQKIGQKRKRHILEGAGGSVPQFKHIYAVVKANKRRGVVALELAVSAFARGKQLLFIVLGKIFFQHLCRALGIAHFKHFPHFLRGYGREFFRHEKPAVIGKPLYYCAGGSNLLSASGADKIHCKLLSLKSRKNRNKAARKRTRRLKADFYCGLNKLLDKVGKLRLRRTAR